MSHNGFEIVTMKWCNFGGLGVDGKASWFHAKHFKTTLMNYVLNSDGSGRTNENEILTMF